MNVKIEPVHVHLDSKITEVNTHPFQLTVDKLEKALLQVSLKGRKTKSLVFMNHNPLGDIYSWDSLKEYLEFAKRYNLHVITDEIYMATVFDESIITVHSVLSRKHLPDPNRTCVIWGTGKGLEISGLH
uniref:Aminotransferase class I/classII large domain-containing protein n=1 Tax=Myotis myotis TaxID=51298 RepID=A0A7J7XZG6_MYOMY|nr:hypothetical protein mMyoMyo1_011342 [Myotis myotis]